MNNDSDFIDPHSVKIDTSRGQRGWPGMKSVPNIGTFLTGIAFVVFLFCGLARGCSRPNSAEQVRQRRIANVSAQFNERRQQIFTAYHPVGTAKKIVVHDVQLLAGPGNQPLLSVRFTIYWEGPVTRDGFTTVLTYFDLDTQRSVGSEVIATNGITNAEASQMAIDFATGFLEELSRQDAARR